VSLLSKGPQNLGAQMRRAQKAGLIMCLFLFFIGLGSEINYDWVNDDTGDLLS